MKVARPQMASRLIRRVAWALWLLTSTVVVAACGASSATNTGGRWQAASPMSEPRSYHTATRLQDGTVLLAGGFPGLTTAEIYDPVSRRSHAIASMGTPRFRHTATLLRDGRALVLGGMRNTDLQALDSGELFDPRTERWTPVAPMSEARGG